MKDETQIPNHLGKVILVGAGPGAADLITLRGMRALQNADCIVHDALLGNELCQLFPAHAELHYVGKRNGCHAASQEAINALLVQLAQQGKNVVRLKGGDPFVFGRGGEEILAMQSADIPWEVIPGVSSWNGAAAAAGIPLTHRGISDSVIVLNGHALVARRMEAKMQITANLGTLAIFMAAGQLREVALALMEWGWSPSTPTALVENASLPEQVVHRTTLADASSGNGIRTTNGPGIIYVGQTVEILTQKQLQWEAVYG